MGRSGACADNQQALAMIFKHLILPLIAFSVGCVLMLNAAIHYPILAAAATGLLAAGFCFQSPGEWAGCFHFVLESCTLQVLPPHLREQAMRRIASFVAPGGTLLVIARGPRAGRSRRQNALAPYALGNGDLQGRRSCRTRVRGLRGRRDSAGPPVQSGLSWENTMTKLKSPWILGMLYINADDPRLFVLAPYKLGWAMNFGNPRAVTALSWISAIFLLGLFHDSDRPSTLQFCKARLLGYGYWPIWRPARSSA